MRLVEHENVTLAMLADAFEGWGSWCPAAARLMLDTAETLWPQTSGSLRTRLMEIFRVAEERMLAFEGDDEDGPAYASLMVVASHGSTLCAAWIGGDVVFHVRMGSITRTSPHTVFEMIRETHGPRAALPSNAKGINTRAIGVRTRHGMKPVDTTPSFATFTIHAGDAIVLVRGDDLESEVVAREATAHADPAKLSACLAQREIEAPRSINAVVVLRFDSDGAPYR